MPPRIETLKRLVDLYGVIEEMHSAELQQKTAAVHEAQRSIAVQQEMAQSAMFDGRTALTVGDRMGWTMAETVRTSAGWKRRRLEDIRLEREGLRRLSREQYLASRLKSEQMKQIVARVTEQIKIEGGRKTQAASDDRFLARRRWTDTRDELRARMDV
jgi:hypothetical protein